MHNKKNRKHLSMDDLLSQIKQYFDTLPSPQKSGISTSDCLMSIMAMFGVKSSSLLQFDAELKENWVLAQNLKQLYRIKTIPSDTYMRERADVVKPDQIRKAFTKVFAQTQRGKVLEMFAFLDNYYLVSVDGTQFFTSKKVHCDYCCETRHSDGNTTYSHKALSAAVVHPDMPYVLPMMPEFICKSDGDTKNDCEINAVKRLLTSMRQEHPHLKITIIEDGLYGNGPHIKLLESLRMKYIIVAKETNHDYLFKWVKDCDLIQGRMVLNGVIQQFEFTNDVPLNDTHHDLRVNFLRYTETNTKGEKKTWSWITNFEITIENVYQIIKGGRSRWHIENQTFNTLKNQGYNFEHNYGHGCKNLSNIMASLMFLCFLIDQIQLITNGVFQKAKQKSRTYARLWEHMRSFFCLFLFENWQELLYAISCIGQNAHQHVSFPP